MTDPARPDLADDLRDLERDLDDLARAERSNAPVGMEQRIALTTIVRLRQSAPRFAGRIRPMPALMGWRRLAAAVALVACAGLVVVAVTRRPGAAPTGAIVEVAAIEADFQAWLADSLLDDGGAVASLREALEGFDAALGSESIDESDPLYAIDLESLS